MGIKEIENKIDVDTRHGYMLKNMSKIYFIFYFSFYVDITVMDNAVDITFYVFVEDLNDMQSAEKIVPTSFITKVLQILILFVKGRLAQRDLGSGMLISVVNYRTLSSH